eukprot:gene12910-12725_t
MRLSPIVIAENRLTPPAEWEFLEPQVRIIAYFFIILPLTSAEKTPLTLSSEQEAQDNSEACSSSRNLQAFIRTVHELQTARLSAPLSIVSVVKPRAPPTWASTPPCPGFKLTAQ